MKTFRQFLEESYEFKPYKIDRHQFGYHHLQYFGNDNVEVRAACGPVRNHYTMTYDVNGSMSKDDNPQLSPSQKLHIGLHAAKMVGHFIKQHNPHQVDFEAYNKEHRAVFHKTASEMAARLGYNHHVEHGDPRKDEPDIHYLVKRKQ